MVVIQCEAMRCRFGGSEIRVHIGAAEGVDGLLGITDEEQGQAVKRRLEYPELM